MSPFICPDDVIVFANRLADASGEVIRRYFRAPFTVEGKADSSPVTIADRKAEEILRALIGAERPQDGIIGEEFGKERDDAEYIWVLDPIDGTRAFACGKPTFGTLIALLRDGEPILGIIDQPVLRERWVGAAGCGTLFNGRICASRSCAELEEAVAFLGLQAFPFGNATSLDAYRRVAKTVRTTSAACDCYGYGLLASGHVDLALEHDLKLYDFAALIPVIEGAGGAIADWQGRKLTRESTGQILAAGSARLLEKAVILLEGAL